MKIIARKRSEDPNQELLREHKDLWNQAAKNAIYKLIAFKRGLNGRGDQHFALPPSNIKEPLPSEVISFLDQMASEYAALVDGAERIIQEQEHYSEIRRRPLAVNASWAGSRWWATTFGIKGEQRKPIKIIVESLDSLKDKLIDMENYLTSSDLNAITEAFSIALTFGVGPYKNIIENYEKLVEMSGKELKDPVKEIKPPKEEIEQVAPIEKSPYYDKLFAIQKDLTNINPVLSYIRDRKSPTDEQLAEIKATRKEIPITIIRAYLKKMIDSPLSEPEMKNLEIVFGAYEKLLLMAKTLTSFDEIDFAAILNKIQQEPINKTEKIHLHDPVSRYLKRKILEYRPDFTRFDVDLDITKKATVENILETIDQIEILFDVLINPFKIDDLHEHLRKLSNNLANVVANMIALAEHYITYYRDEYRDVGRKTLLKPIRREETNNLRDALKKIRAMSAKTLQDKSTINIIVNR